MHDKEQLTSTGKAHGSLARFVSLCRGPDIRKRVQQDFGSRFKWDAVFSQV